MCNEAARRTALGLMRDDFSQLKIPLLFPEDLPNLADAPSVRITDPTVIVRTARDSEDVGTAEMVQRRWSWSGPHGKPVYNYRSEGRSFANSATGGRCLVPLDGFYEFTDAAPGAKRKTKWLFTLRDSGAARPAPRLFCVAGLWRAGVALGKDGVGEAFTMLTCEPGPDIAPYHARQIVVMPRERWADWIGGVVPAEALIAPTPAGTLAVVAAR